MKTKYIIEVALSLCLSVGFNACNYLDANEYLNEVENLNDIWTERNSIRKAWAACYGAMPNYSNMVDGWPFNCNYDEGHGGLDNYKCLLFAQGKYDADKPLFDYWSHYYKAIRLCCQFLENSHKANDKLLVEGEVEGYAADARFLRAFYYSQMLELYGPFVIIDKTIDYSQLESYPTTREPIDACVDFILKELEICIEQLPVNEEILSSDYGRPSKEAAMAVKARVLLWAASPLTNGNPDYSDFLNKKGEYYFNVQAPDIEKWKKAAKAAKDIIDLQKFDLFTLPANDKYTTVPLGDFKGNDVAWPDGPAGIDPYRSYKALFAGGKNYWNKEVIWQVNTAGQTSNLSSLGFPRTYNKGEGGSSVGKICAVQKIVDAYFMNNGNTIEEEKELYNDLSMTTIGDSYYIHGNGKKDNISPIISGFRLNNTIQKIPNRCLNREARFYATIGFIGRGYVENNGNLYYADFRANMVDGYLQSDRPSIRSGYPIVKWVNDEDQKTSGSFDKQYSVFRMAEIYLSYAEALNEYDPTHADVLKYLNLIRYRAGLPGYGNSNQETNRERIKRERYVEFAFEGKRYFDSRRWKDAEKNQRDNYGNSKGMNGLVYGCNYNATDGAFYDRAVIDGYLFKRKNYFLPIPYSEVANHWGDLVQNPGW